MYLIIIQNKWSEELHKEKSIEVFKDFSLLTLDVMLQTAFSYKSHCQSEELVILCTVAIYMCVCVCVYIRMYQCVHVCVCDHVHTYAYVCLCVYVYLICVYVRRFSYV